MMRLKSWVPTVWYLSVVMHAKATQYMIVVAHATS